jgi:hypothetical protein
MFFANENRERVREENPGIAFGTSCAPLAAGPLLTRPKGALGRRLGELWKALSETDRKPYEDKAVADKKRYEDQKASYNVRVALVSDAPRY